MYLKFPEQFKEACEKTMEQVDPITLTEGLNLQKIKVEDYKNVQSTATKQVGTTISAALRTSKKSYISDKILDMSLREIEKER